MDTDKGDRQVRIEEDLRSFYMKPGEFFPSGRDFFIALHRHFRG